MHSVSVLNVMRQRALPVLLIAAVVALIVVMIVLHVTGVLGPGDHG